VQGVGQNNNAKHVQRQRHILMVKLFMSSQVVHIRNQIIAHSSVPYSETTLFWGFTPFTM